MKFSMGMKAINPTDFLFLFFFIKNLLIASLHLPQATVETKLWKLSSLETKQAQQPSN